VLKKFLEFLKIITNEVLNNGKQIEDVIMRLDTSDINLYMVNEELRELEKNKLIDGEEADTIKSILFYLFLKDTDMELEEIYAVVFGDGKRLKWH